MDLRGTRWRLNGVVAGKDPKSEEVCLIALVWVVREKEESKMVPGF